MPTPFFIVLSIIARITPWTALPKTVFAGFRPQKGGGASREVSAAVVIGFSEQCLSVAFGEAAVVDQFDCFVGELEQANGVREVASAAAKPPRQSGRGEVQFVDQGGDCACLFDHAEVFACDVLDQRQLDRLGRVNGLGHQGGDCRRAGDHDGWPRHHRTSM